MLSVTFDVDHKVLDRGVYLAKIDRRENVCALTLDIRLRRPYREPIMTEKEMHTFEHVYATAIRTVTEEKADADVIYFGPMGCNTGFYLVFLVTAKDDEELERVALRLPAYMDEGCAYLKDMARVPAANEYQCGNCYSLSDMATARALGEDLSELLKTVKREGYTQYVRLSPDVLAALEA